MKVLQILVLFSVALFCSSLTLCQDRFENRVLVRGTVKFAETFYSSEKATSPSSLGKDAIVDAVDKNGSKYSTTTDEKGYYELRLPIGEYQIRAHIPTGFSIEISSEINNLVVKKTKKIKLNFILFSGSCG